MALKSGTLLEVDSSLIQVVKKALDKDGKILTSFMRRRRSVLDENFGGGSYYDYNGFFKINYVVDDEGFPESIVVCDGETYDHVSGTSNDSIASFRGRSFPVPFWNTPVEDGEYCIVLIFNMGKNIAEIYSVKLGDETKIPVPHYIIGNYSYMIPPGETTRVLKITQRHGAYDSRIDNGVAYVEWDGYLGYFTICCTFEINSKFEVVHNLVWCGDGLTFDWHEGSSGDSVAQVNDKIFDEVPDFTIAPTGDTETIIAEYDPLMDDVIIKVQEKKDPNSSGEEEEEEEEPNPYVVIGTFSGDGQISFSQRHGVNNNIYHTDGRVKIEYFLRCDQIIRKEKEDDEEDAEPDNGGEE